MLKLQGTVKKKEIMKEKYFTVTITDGSLYPTKVNLNEDTFNKLKIEDKLDLEVVAFANQTKDKSRTYISLVEKK